MTITGFAAGLAVATALLVLPTHAQQQNGYVCPDRPGRAPEQVRRGDQADRDFFKGTPEPETGNTRY